MDGKTQLTDAEIESLYNLEGFEEKAGDMAAFAEMSFGEQREIMKQYYAEQQNILHSNLDTAIAEMEQYYNEIEAYAANHNLSQMLSDQVEGLTVDQVAQLRQMIVESTNFGHDWTEIIKPKLEAWGVENAQNLFSGLSTTWTNVINGTIDASAEGRYKEAGNTLATLRRAKTTDYSIKDTFKANKKAWDEEFDLYAKWENELEKISKSLEKLEKVQSHLHGKELIKSLENENKLLKEQSQLNEGLLTAKTQRAGELKTTLASKFAGKVQFDENGAITNYEEVSKEMLNWYNNRQDEDSEAIYEDFKKYLEEYSNLYYQEIPELQNTLLDDMYETISNNLEAWEVEIELQLDTKEAEREMLDFAYETSDNFKKEFSDIGAELNHILSISGTYTQPGGTIAADTQAINDVIAEINKMEQMGDSYYDSEDAMFGSMSEAQAKLEELQSTLLDDAKEVHQAWQDGWDAYMEGIDQAQLKKFLDSNV